MKLIKIQEYLTDFEYLLDILSQEIDIEDLNIGLIGINETEFRIVDNISNKVIVIPTDLQTWNAEALLNLVGDATALSIKVSDSYLQDLELEDYSMEDILPCGADVFTYANIRAGDVEECKNDGTEMDILDPSYWSTITGIKNTPSKTSKESQKEPGGVFTKTTINAGPLEANEKKESVSKSENTIKVRDALKAAFEGCSMPTAAELDRLKYIFKEIFKHDLTLGDPSQDFKYDLVGLKKNKYTHIYVLKIPKIPFTKLIKEQERISGIFSPDAVYKIEESYKRVSGVFAIHVNVDTQVMNDTHSLLDVYLKRNRFADYDGRFGDPKNLVIGFAPSGLVLADATNQTACQYLVAGSTGSGKSVTIQSLILQFIADGSLVFYFDPKVSDSLPYKDYGIAVANTSEEIYTQMEKLYKIYRAQKAKTGPYIDIEGYNAKHPDAKIRRIVVIFDEYESFIISIKGKKDKLKQTEVKLTEIVAQGRSAGINVIIGSQTPSAEYINKSLRGNLVLKLLGTSCGPYFKNYLMTDLKAVPSSPQDDIYRYAGMFTSNLTKCVLKSLYIEVKKPSPELGKTEFQYLMEKFDEDGLIVATQDILNDIQLEGENEDDEEGAVEGTVLDDDFFDSLAKPIIDEEDDDDDEDYEDDDNLVEAPSTSKSKKSSSSDTNSVGDSSNIITEPNTGEGKSHKESNPILSDEARYKKDNNLTPRDRQMMVEYFSLIDKNTNKLSVPTKDIPVIFTGKTAKVPDTSSPKYNLYSSFSLKNKLRAKAVNFVGKFSSSVADKLRHSVGLENSVAHKATYIFLYTFSKSRRLDNIQCLAFSSKTNTIYINEIPRVLEDDINVNDSGPYADKYVTIDPKNFYYPEIANLDCLERLMFDSPSIAYKAIEQVNSVIFNNDYYECVDLLFAAQESLKEITIYDKVYYRSSKKAKAIKNKLVESNNRSITAPGPIEQDKTENTMASKSYQDEIDEFYNAMAMEDLKKRFDTSNLEPNSIIEDNSKEIEELTLGSIDTVSLSNSIESGNSEIEENFNIEDTIDDIPDISDDVLDMGVLDMGISEEELTNVIESLAEDIQSELTLGPIDSVEHEVGEVAVENNPIDNDTEDSNATKLRFRNQNSEEQVTDETAPIIIEETVPVVEEVKEVAQEDSTNYDDLTEGEIRIIKSNKAKAALNYKSRSYHVDIDYTINGDTIASNNRKLELLDTVTENRLILKVVDNDLEITRGYSKDSLAVLEKCSCGAFSKVTIASEHGKSFIGYSDIVAKNIIKTEMNNFVNIEDFFEFDPNKTMKYKIVYFAKNTGFLLKGKSTTLDLAPMDIRFYCIECLRNTPVETLKQCLVDMAQAERYSRNIYSTSSAIYRALLMYRLICNPNVGEFLITDYIENSQFETIRNHYNHEHIYYILESGKKVLNIENSVINSTIEASLIKILGEFSTFALPLTLKKAISEIYTDLNLEHLSKQVLKTLPVENLLNLEDIYPTPTTYVDNQNVVISNNKLKEIEQLYAENIESLIELTDCNDQISKSVFEMYTGITYEQARLIPIPKMKEILETIKLDDVDESKIDMLEQALEADLQDIAYAHSDTYPYRSLDTPKSADSNLPKEVDNSVEEFIPRALTYNSENNIALAETSDILEVILNTLTVVTYDDYYTYINGNCLSRSMEKIQNKLQTNVVDKLNTETRLRNIVTKLSMYNEIETRIEHDLVKEHYMIYLEGISREFVVEYRFNSNPRTVFNKTLEADGRYKVPHFYLYEKPIEITDKGAILASNFMGNKKKRLDTKTGYKIFDALNGTAPVKMPGKLRRLEFQVPLDYRDEYDKTVYELLSIILITFKSNQIYYELSQTDIVDITAVTLHNIREILYKNRK